jgi:hypothetical protein
MKAVKERNISAEMEATGKELFIQMETQISHECPFLKFFINVGGSRTIGGVDGGEDDDVIILMIIMIMLMSGGGVCGEKLVFYLLNDG